MGLVMGGLTLKGWQGGNTGDIAQLGEQRLDDGLTIGLNEADTTHGASEELTTFELNHDMSTQPCTLYVHKLATVRTPSRYRHTLAEQQTWIEGKGERWMKRFDGIVAGDLLQATGLNPAISAQHFKHCHRPTPPHTMDDGQTPRLVQAHKRPDGQGC